MHPDFNPKFSHLKPSLFFSHISQKMHSLLQCKQWEEMGGVGEWRRGGIRRKGAVLIQCLNCMSGNGGDNSRMDLYTINPHCLSFCIIVFE